MKTKATSDDLIAAARRARARAYAPYSGSPTGAALLCDSGRIVEACNIENASFGLTICAERAAVARAVSEGEQRFAAIAVTTANQVNQVPCGACLQVLAEFCDPEFSIYLQAEGGKLAVEHLGTLLTNPFRFRSAR